MNDIKIVEKVSKTQFSIFMRQLHILALVQHSVESEKLNYRSIADLLSSISWDSDADDGKIKRSVNNLKSMGFPIHTAQGEDRIFLERELSDDEMLEILPYYLNVVSDTVGIRDCFKNYVANQKSRSLWIIARIYFASLHKKQIRLAYYSVNKGREEVYTLNPYRWVYRDNAVYLIARNILKGDDISLYRLNRIKDLTVTDIGFDDEIPAADELMKHSMGAFINSRNFNVRLAFKTEYRERIEEEFGHLEIRYTEADEDGFMYADFTVCDIINVCKAVFGYCGKVKIIGDSDAVGEMKRMIEGNSVY